MLIGGKRILAGALLADKEHELLHDGISFHVV
jgi:hypothetical protein